MMSIDTWIGVIMDALILHPVLSLQQVASVVLHLQAPFTLQWTMACKINKKKPKGAGSLKLRRMCNNRMTHISFFYFKRRTAT